MSFMQNQFHRHIRRVTAITLLGALYLLARLPDIGAGERAALTQRFHFEQSALPVVAGPEVREVRPVHRSLEHISAWISAVGGAVALNDLDGDGLPNDVCYVDTRTDQVIVTPAPGTGARYQPFVLNAGA